MDLKPTDEVVRKRPCPSPGSHEPYGMHLKYAFAAFTAASAVVLSLPGCTEPKAPPSFQGTITSIGIIAITISPAPRNRLLEVVNPGAGDEECRRANVQVNGSTLIHSAASPGVNFGLEVLTVGQD